MAWWAEHGWMAGWVGGWVDGGIGIDGKMFACMKNDSICPRLLEFAYKSVVMLRKNLDVAIDIHISLVQMRQHAAAGLAQGKDFGQVMREAIESMQQDRAAAGAMADVSHSFCRSSLKEHERTTTWDIWRS